MKDAAAGDKRLLKQQPIQDISAKTAARMTMTPSQGNAEALENANADPRLVEAREADPIDQNLVKTLETELAETLVPLRLNLETAREKAERAAEAARRAARARRRPRPGRGRGFAGFGIAIPPLSAPLRLHLHDLRQLSAAGVLFLILLFL